MSELTKEQISLAKSLDLDVLLAAAAFKLGLTPEDVGALTSAPSAVAGQSRDEIIEECAYAVGELDGGDFERDKALIEAMNAIRALKNAAPQVPQQEDSPGVLESITGERPKARNESGSDTAPAAAASLSSSIGGRTFHVCEDHKNADWNQPELDDDACVLCRLFYLEAQESLLEEWQQRAKRAEEAAAEIQRPLDAQMARLNETVVRLNAENERLIAPITEEEAAQLLDDGFSVKVLNCAPPDGNNGGKNYWRCPHCGMADYDGHEQSCIIRALVERLLGRVVPFGTIVTSATARAIPIPAQCELLHCTRPAVKDGRCSVHSTSTRNAFKEKS